MSPEELNEHIENEYRRATGLAPGFSNPDVLVTELADFAQEWKERIELAAGLGALHMLDDGIDGTLPYIEGVREALDEAMKQVREDADE